LYGDETIAKAMPFRNVLFPTDFSDSSRRALRYAVELVRESAGSLTMLHVWDIKAYSIKGETVSLLSDIAAEAARLLADWKREAEELGAKQVATAVVEGIAWDKIVETARKESGFDLVVMGTQGRTGLKHALIGSVAEKVVRHAPCPVLVIRQRDQ
jgi:nucleotide-binding universal stress UspA family protein